MGWASEAAAEIEAIASKRESERNWTMFAADRIKAEADGLWALIAAQVTADFQEFNEARKRRSGLSLERIGPHNVTITRLLAPLAVLRFEYTPNSRLSVLWKNKCVSQYRLFAQDDGSVWFVSSEDEPMTPEKISRLAFAPLMELYRRGLLV